MTSQDQNKCPEVQMDIRDEVQESKDTSVGSHMCEHCMPIFSFGHGHPGILKSIITYKVTCQENTHFGQKGDECRCHGRLLVDRCKELSSACLKDGLWPRANVDHFDTF